MVESSIFFPPLTFEDGSTTIIRNGAKCGVSNQFNRVQSSSILQKRPINIWVSNDSADQFLGSSILQNTQMAGFIGPHGLGRRWCNRTGYGPGWDLQRGPFSLGTSGGAAGAMDFLG